MEGFVDTLLSYSVLSTAVAVVAVGYALWCDWERRRAESRRVKAEAEGNRWKFLYLSLDEEDGASVNPIPFYRWRRRR